MLRSSRRYRLVLNLLLVVAVCLTLVTPSVVFAEPGKGGPPELVKVQGHDTVVITVSPSQAKVIHVESINLSWKVVGKRKQVVAIVSVRDADGKSVSGATVTGKWSGLVSGNVSCSTNSGGDVAFTSKTVTKAGRATFTVTGVKPPTGYTYDPILNLEASDFIDVPK